MANQKQLDILRDGVEEWNRYRETAPQDAVDLSGAYLERAIFSFDTDLRGANLSWAALSGAVTLLLGVMIWRRWPGDGLWVIGTLVGIDLIFNGLTLVMLGIAVRSATKSVPETGTQ